MTFEELFRMVQATLLVLTFSGMCRTVFNRWKHMTPVGKRQYCGFMYLTFWMVLSTLWRLHLGTDLAWTNIGFFSGVMFITFTLWWRAYDEGPELHERLARPRLDDPADEGPSIHHDNPGVQWTAPDEAAHRSPRLNPEDYMEAVEDQVERDQKDR